jgi:ketosteroid isomerase-like protein
MTGPRDIFERQRRTVLDYDMEGQAALFADDGVMEFPFAPEGFPGRLAGREQIAAVLSAAVEPLKRSGRRLIEYRDIVVHETKDPEVIIVEFEVHGETAEGEPFRLPYIQVWRVRDNEIVSLRDYWSAATAPVRELTP